MLEAHVVIPTAWDTIRFFPKSRVARSLLDLSTLETSCGPCIWSVASEPIPLRVAGPGALGCEVARDDSDG